MPCLEAYCPRRMLARLSAQSDVVTKAFVKTTPREATPSRWGVRMIGFPMHPRVSNLWSSLRRKRMLGLPGSPRPASEVAHPPGARSARTATRIRAADPAAFFIAFSSTLVSRKKPGRRQVRQDAQLINRPRPEITTPFRILSETPED